MANLIQSRNPHISLFQSAVDEVISRKNAETTRPDPEHPMVQMAAQPAAFGGVLSYCASLAKQYGEAMLEGRTADASRIHAELTQKMGDCDPAWVDCAAKYAQFLLSKQKIPYRVYKNIGDFVVEGKLSPNARIAFVGDWGTGQDIAIKVLQQIARKKPDVVIHMGDVYYAGTDFEMETYFYNIWSQTLDLKAVATYTLAGNHDMFSGGAPYYKLIDQLGQPASYFCLRNDEWQFIAMDTGLHDSDPMGTTPTYLEQTEVAWVADKIQNAVGRRTMLLSHHQLFSGWEPICGQSVNPQLNAQLSGLLPSVDMWLWGHEHNLTIYEKYLGVLGRCIGHGAFPIGIHELPATPPYPNIPTKPVTLGNNGEFYNHGYVIMDLDGKTATLSYYQDSDESTPQFTENL